MSQDRPSLRIDGEDKTSVRVSWGRTGKRAIITVSSQQSGTPRQAVLTPDQAAELGRFLTEGPDAPR